MQTVLIVIHLIIVVALVGVVLLQRSEGGALGIGGGSGGMMSARGAADALTRTTGILAAAFFATSMGLGILARYEAQPTDVLDRIEQTAPSGGQSILDQIGGSTGSSDIPTPASTPDGSAGSGGDSQVPTGQ